MKIFLSWSGNSKRVAEALKDWLKSVIQALDPWISSEDIQKGARWSPEIAQQLSDSKTGIVCVTSENQNETWLNFEAGAISNAAGQSRVCTYLLDLKPTDLAEGPLSQFQATTANKEDTLRLLKTLNASLEKGALAEKVLEKTFEKFWPDLSNELDEIKAAMTETSPEKSPRSEIEMIEETLGIVRELRNHQSQGELNRTVTPANASPYIISGFPSGLVTDSTPSLPLDYSNKWSTMPYLRTGEGYLRVEYPIESPFQLKAPREKDSSPTSKKMRKKKRAAKENPGQT
jgi:hypothetical protein